jgi:hypothetical protein
MNEIRAEIADFEKSVNTYISEVVPDLTTRLIDCINHSIHVAKTKIDSGYGAIDVQALKQSEDDGDRLIGEIEKLLAELEADGP